MSDNKSWFCWGLERSDSKTSQLLVGWTTSSKRHSHVCLLVCENICWAYAKPWIVVLVKIFSLRVHPVNCRRWNKTFLSLLSTFILHLAIPNGGFPILGMAAFAVLRAGRQFADKKGKLQETISMAIMVYIGCPVAFLLTILSQLVCRQYVVQCVVLYGIPKCCPELQWWLILLMWSWVADVKMVLLLFLSFFFLLL